MSHTSGASQHPTPPASSASSTPSPSNAPFHSGASRIVQSEATNGYCTPPPQPARNCGTGAPTIFYDAQLLRSSSQSSLVLAASEAGTETPKRKATEAPEGRPRNQTISHTRSQSMAIISRSQSHSASLEQHPRQTLGVLDSSLSRDPSSNTQQDPNQEVNTPQPGTFDSNISSNLDQHPIFKDGEEDSVEPGSNKRPKSGLRGVEGRRSRTVYGQQRSTLKHCSTGSIINNLSLTGSKEDNKVGNNDDNDDDNSNDDLPMAPPATKTPPDFEVWHDKEQTPIKKTSPRRAPLTDISLSIGTPTMVRFFNVWLCLLQSRVRVCV